MTALEAAGFFRTDGAAVSASPYGMGRIHDTYLAATDTGRRYLLQRVNTTVFTQPVRLMENILNVTSFLRDAIEKGGGDPERGTLTVVCSRPGEPFYRAQDGEFWRCYLFLEGTEARQTATPETFCEAARAFGSFQRLLEGYPAERLHVSLPDFHHTPRRFEAFFNALDEDVCDRSRLAGAEVEFAAGRRGSAGVIADALDLGRLPRRVTHNDTKLNNILFDRITGKAVCVVDLDTVMPGSPLYDFGDAVRYGACTVPEDAASPGDARLDTELYRAFVSGYAEEASLTELEKKLLPWGAWVMTLECGLRFLTDYLSGDVYFHAEREHSNLERCRVQFGLLADMERRWGELCRITAEYA